MAKKKKKYKFDGPSYIGGYAELKYQLIKSGVPKSQMPAIIQELKEGSDQVTVMQKWKIVDGPLFGRFCHALKMFQPAYREEVLRKQAERAASRNVMEGLRDASRKHQRHMRRKMRKLHEKKKVVSEQKPLVQVVLNALINSYRKIASEAEESIQQLYRCAGEIPKLRKKNYESARAIARLQEVTREFTAKQKEEVDSAPSH